MPQEPSVVLIRASCLSAACLCLFMCGCRGASDRPPPPISPVTVDGLIAKQPKVAEKGEKEPEEEKTERESPPNVKEISLKSTLPRVVVVLADGRVALVPLDVIKQHRTDAPATKEAAVSEDDGMLTLATRGKGAVRLPLALVESFIDAEARPGHGKTAKRKRGAGRSKGLSASGRGGESGSEWENGEATFHTDYEYGECEYTDESGFVTQAEQWHNHPHGTEYTEILTP
ncbi:MAG: hypothetical protein VB934_00670 [Polyangiaceae bacterium]